MLSDPAYAQTVHVVMGNNNFQVPPYWAQLNDSRQVDLFWLLLLLDALANPFDGVNNLEDPAAHETLANLKLADKLLQLTQQHNAMHIYGHGSICRLLHRPLYLKGVGLCGVFRARLACFLIVGFPKVTPTGSSVSALSPAFCICGLFLDIGFSHRSRSCFTGAA